MRKVCLAGVAIVAALALPGVASAHSGHVTCDATGVVYNFDANFPANTVVTEHVNGVERVFTPPAFAVSTDTFPVFIGGVYTVSASWSGGGSIPPTVLNCPGTPPPPVIPPPITPPPVVPPAPPVVPPTAPPVCAKGTVQVSFVNNVLICQKTVIKIKIKKITKIQWKIRYIQWCKHPPKKPPGVLG